MVKGMTIPFLVGILFIFAAMISVLLSSVRQKPAHFPSPTQTIPSSTPTPLLQKALISKLLANDYHIFQTFNNCGPAALSMALSYYGIYKLSKLSEKFYALIKFQGVIMMTNQ